MTLDENGSLRDNENVLEIDVIVLQICEYAKKHWIIHFKSVNFGKVNYISVNEIRT